MRTLRADSAGACFGVQRALTLAQRAAEDYDQVKSLGPLIHNPQVVAQLAQSGVEAVSAVDPSYRGAVVIRSHGVGPAEHEALNRDGLVVIDATCPHVARAQRAAVELAQRYRVVLVVGDAQHPEVEAIRAFAQQAGGDVRIVDEPASIPADLPAQVGVVVQTTQNREVFDAIIAALKEAGVEADVRDTICNATSKRQAAARDLASRVDAMVVIGGHNSSNTTRLYEICKTICAKTYHIETVSELDADDFVDCETVGITAGASTPESQILPVEEFFERL